MVQLDVIEKAGALSCMLLNYESLAMKFSQLQSVAESVGAKADVLEEKVSSIVSPFKVNPDVVVWLNKHREISKSFEKLNERFQRQRWFHFVNYARLQRTIQCLQRSFDDLSKRQISTQVSRRVKHEGEVENLISFVGDQFQKQKAMVYEWLESQNDHVCGVCGIGGIGKTALLEDVYFSLENDRRYRMCWVNVTKDCTITKLQDAIAMALSVYPLDGNGLQRRVDFLKTLKMVKNLVIILENLSDWIPLHEVGIPVGKNGCKVIIATRSVTVCREMQCQSYIKMEYLGEEPSWELFAEKFGKFEHGLEHYASSLVKQCWGLPLAILELARHMREVDDVYEWKDMCNCMQHSSFDNYLLRESFQVLNCSYMSLENSQLRDCFLCCSLFPKNSLVERKMLIRVFVEADLIECSSGPTIVFYRVHSILNKLENIFLLNGAIDESGRKCITMHPLVRDFAKQIFKSRTTDSDQRLLKETHEKWEYVVESHYQSLLDKVPTTTKDVIEDGFEPETHARGTESSSTQVPTCTTEFIHVDSEVLREKRERLF